MTFLELADTDAGAEDDRHGEASSRPVTLRIKPDMLARLDAAARRLGLSRAAFVLSAAAERLERMNG